MVKNLGVESNFAVFFNQNSMFNKSLQEIVLSPLYYVLEVAKMQDYYNFAKDHEDTIILISYLGYLCYVDEIKYTPTCSINTFVVLVVNTFEEDAAIHICTYAAFYKYVLDFYIVFFDTQKQSK